MVITKAQVLDDLRREIVQHDHMVGVASRVKAPRTAAYHRGARDALKAALAFAADVGMNAIENSVGIGALAV